MAILLAEMALHLGGSMESLLLAAAAVVAVLGLVTDGPLGALRVVPRGMHRVADLVVGAAFVLLPLAAIHHLDLVGVLMAEGAALVLLRLAFITRYHPAPKKVGAGPALDGSSRSGPLPLTDSMGANGSRLPDASARSRGPAAGRAGALAGSARALGLVTGRAQRRAAREAPRADRALGQGARRLGGALGRRASEEPRQGAAKVSAAKAGVAADRALGHGARRLGGALARRASRRA